MKLIRVFPRITNATPDDDNVRFAEPGLFDNADKVLVSVTWTWDKSRGEELAENWTLITKNVSIGGPAYNDPGGEFIPGMFLKNGYTITSRGCPNKCWFCHVPKREGTIRELEIKDGYNILDSNLLACSDEHIKKVFDMLSRQKQSPRFTGGLETKLLKEWHIEYLKRLKPRSVFFAYDDPDDYDPLVAACEKLNRFEILPDRSRAYRCYVLIGYKNDTIEKATNRLESVMKLGLMPMAMLYDKGIGNEKKIEWNKFQREYANLKIIGSKFSKIQKEIKNENISVSAMQ